MPSLGVIGIKTWSYTSNTKGKLDESILDTVLAFDEAIAQVLDIRQQQTVARFLQQAQDGTTQHASSIGPVDQRGGDIGRALKDRLAQIAEGLIGRQLGGLADRLAQISDRDVNEIQTEGQRLIDIIALFADGFERGIRALTGGLNPLEQQIFGLEEAAKAAAKGTDDERRDGLEKRNVDRQPAPCFMAIEGGAVIAKRPLELRECEEAI